jgi:hypothetical protein
MVIRYCEKCGVLVTHAETPRGTILCPDCAAGKVRHSRYLRDSDRIPKRFRRAFYLPFQELPLATAAAR